jgi:hypothetical protein
MEARLACFESQVPPSPSPIINSGKTYGIEDKNACRVTYEEHLESKERFAIKKYLLIIGKKKNMQVLSHTFAYFST